MLQPHFSNMHKACDIVLIPSGHERVIRTDYLFAGGKHFRQTIYYIEVHLAFRGSVTGNLQGN